MQDERAGLKEVSENVYYDYKNFVDINKERLKKTFGEKVSFKTSSRGIKFRGAFDTKEDANAHSEYCGRRDKNKFAIHVVSMGHWMDLDTNTSKNKEYPNADLNRLMHEMDKNSKLAESEFDARKDDKVKKAMAENVKCAEKTGNKLTQYQDEDGNLINTTIASSVGAAVTVDDIEKALFDGANIATKSERAKHDSAIRAKLTTPRKFDTIADHETTVD